MDAEYADNIDPAEISAHIEDLGDLLSPAERRVIAEAVAMGTGLMIGYIDSHGQETTRLVTNPTLVNRQMLRGHCHLRGEDRIFRLEGLQWARRGHKG